MARKLFNLARGPILLYTGRFSPDKNIGALLATFQSIGKSIPDAQLVLAIRHQSGAYRQALNRQLAGVRILTDLAAQQLAHLYSAADIFVTCATSYYETFGRSPLEAVACGTTVVAPAWDGFKSYVSGGHGGQLVPVDFLADPLYDEWSYAMVNIPEMVRCCLDVLNGQHHADGTLDYNLTSQATVGRLNRLLQDLTDNDIQMASGIGIGRIQDGRVWKAIEELGAIDLENIYRLTTCAEEALPVLTVNATRDLFVALYS
jgi:hypothetical protein